MHNVLKIVLISVVFGLSVLPAAAQEHKTIWSGIFTEEQAARGEKAFVSNCARCHLADLSGKNGPMLKGDRFIDDFREASLSILFSVVKNMPPPEDRIADRPPVSTALDIMTFILKVNGAPPGPQELTMAAIPGIQFEKQTGPEEPPNQTAVSLVGCLVEDPTIAWLLTQASDPVRTMNSDVLSPDELAAAAKLPPGRNTFRLAQIGYIDTPIEDHKDHLVEIKGTLLRQENVGVRINLTALQTIGGICQ